MKKLFLMFALILCSAPAWATFTLVQNVNNDACGSGSITSCTLTVASTGSGHVIVVIGAWAVTNRSITSITGGSGTYTHCTACTTGSGVSVSSDISYTLNSTSGSTSIVMNFAASATAADVTAEMFEFSFTGTSVLYDTGNTQFNTTNTERGGVTLSGITGTNDLLIQGISLSANATITAVNSPYSGGTTNFQANGTFGTGFVALPNSVSTTAPTYTWTTNAFSAGTAIAISETASGSNAAYQIGGFLVGP